MPYGNTMIWCEELDALSTYRDIVSAKFAEDLAQIARPSTPGLVLMSLYGTLVDPPLADQLARGLMESGVRRAAFIGLDRKTRGLLRDRLNGAVLAYSFHDDCEQGKEWLAGLRP